MNRRSNRDISAGLCVNVRDRECDCHTKRALIRCHGDTSARAFLLDEYFQTSTYTNILGINAFGL